MVIGKVIGNVWATRKHEKLSGLKFMIVEPCDFKNHQKQYPIVAADVIGAGIGETVLVVTGSSARDVAGDKSRPLDCTIVGIIDEADTKVNAD